MSYIIIKTTAENYKEAENIANRIIKEKLGACIQLSEIKSFYKWNGKTESSKEVKIEIKTKSSNYKKIEQLIKNISKYKTPQIIAVKIKKGSRDYLNWVDENC